jgi:serine/threonine-protein kinase
MAKGRGLSLGARIFLGTAALLVLALGVAIIASISLGNRIALAATHERIRAANSVATAVEQQRLEQLKLMVRSLTDNPEYKAYFVEGVANRDALSLYDQLDERRQDLGYDFALLVDPQGRLLVRSDDQNATGVDLSKQPLVARVMTESEASGIWHEGGKLYDAVALPLAQQFAAVAYLVAGYGIDDRRAIEIQKLSSCDVVFLSDSPAGAAITASTLPKADQDKLVAALRLQGDVLSRVMTRGEVVDEVELTLGGERWLGLLAPLKDAAGRPAGATITLASLDQQLEGYRRLRQLLILAGVAALAGALGLSWVLGRRVFAPVERLATAAEAARGGNYDVRVPEGGSAEVDGLARSFNGLIGELREKRDMQEYVTRLARNLPERGSADVAERPSQKTVTLMAIELRRYVRPQRGLTPEQTLDRLSRDLARVSNSVSSHGGEIVAVYGHRVLASFESPTRSAQALTAAGEVTRAVGTRENAFDEAEPPAIAVAAGEVVAGTVSYGENLDRALVGTPVQQAETLLREALEGDILLTPAVHADVTAMLDAAGIVVQPQRGLLSTQAIFQLSAEQAAKATGSMSSQPTQEVSLSAPAAAQERATLSAIGPGTLLGSRFEILATLGAGGMGMVFKARDRELDDLVALKTLKPEVAGDAALAERLKSELKLARKITHANVLRTYDFGEVDGIAYISMEYVRGITLRSMLEQTGRLPYSAGLRLARQLLSGLAAAHSEGILHRDIKPENIILDPMGNVKLMDFGLARPVHRMTPGQTQAGWIVGTPHYMAPEQLQGTEPDRRADVYACGVVLYEVFTGALPFGGSNPMEIIMQHLQQPPTPARTYWPEIPAWLDQVIATCLEKDPARRFPSAAELAGQFESRSV